MGRLATPARRGTYEVGVDSTPDETHDGPADDDIVRIRALNQVAHSVKIFFV